MTSVGPWVQPPDVRTSVSIEIAMMTSSDTSAGAAHLGTLMHDDLYHDPPFRTAGAGHFWGAGNGQYAIRAAVVGIDCAREMPIVDAGIPVLANATAVEYEADASVLVAIELRVTASAVAYVHGENGELIGFPSLQTQLRLVPQSVFPVFGTAPNRYPDDHWLTPGELVGFPLVDAADAVFPYGPNFEGYVVHDVVIPAASFDGDFLGLYWAEERSATGGSLPTPPLPAQGSSADVGDSDWTARLVYRPPRVRWVYGTGPALAATRRGGRANFDL